MTICTLEGYSQRGGLSQAGTRAAPPTPTSALLFSHPLLIPQPITFNSVPGTSKPGKGHRVQWRLGDLLEPARLSWVRQRGASRCWLRRLCSFPGRLPPASLIRAGPICLPLPPRRVGGYTRAPSGNPFLRQGALERSEREKRPFPDGRPQMNGSDEEPGAPAAWEAARAALLPFLMF